MKKERLNLGKLLIFLLFPIILSAASVRVEVDKPAIYPGESVSFTITASGKGDVKFPNIKDIDGFLITGTSDSQSTIIINGEVKKSVSRTYIFSPTKDVTIPSFEVEINGKKYKTKPVKIKILTPKPSSNSHGEVSLTLKASKKEVYVGEPVRVDIIFKKRADANIDKVEIEEPKFKDFWVKRIQGSQKGVDGEYITQTYSFIVFPQKSGKLKIPPIAAKIGKAVKTRGGFFNDPFFNDPFFNDPFFQRFTTKIKWRKIFSNSLELSVKPLPDNLEVYGDFILKAKTDKKRVKANKPVNLTIQIAGEGNIDDIKKFEIDIPNAVVYSDDPKISTKIENGKYVGTFTQKVAIIADRSFTIPSIEFRYFDKNLKKEVIKKTKPIHIEVIGSSSSAKNEKPIIEEKKTEPVSTEKSKNAKNLSKESENPFAKYLFLFLGYVLGIFTVWGFYKLKEIKPQKKETPIVKKIRRAKSDKELFETLLPYAKEDKLISDALKKLEENIYKKASYKVDREELAEYFQERERE